MSAAMKLENPLTDKRLVTSLVETVSNILVTMASTTATPLKPYIESNFSFSGDVVGSIGLTSQTWKGSLMVCFSKDAILKILENMLGEKYTEVNKDVADAVGELTNMIYGSTKTVLNQMGYTFEMAIPQVVTGNFTISQPPKGATLVVPFQLQDKSKFEVKVAVQ